MMLFWEPWSLREWRAYPLGIMQGKNNLGSRLATVLLRWPWSRGGHTGRINFFSLSGTLQGQNTVSFCCGVQFYTDLPISSDPQKILNWFVPFQPVCIFLIHLHPCERLLASLSVQPQNGWTGATSGPILLGLCRGGRASWSLSLKNLENCRSYQLPFRKAKSYLFSYLATIFMDDDEKMENNWRLIQPHNILHINHVVEWKFHFITIHILATKLCPLQFWCGT